MGSKTDLPVMQEAIKTSNSIDGWDSVLSNLQMPSGVPVATVALNGAKNAGILAAQIIAVHNDGVQQAMHSFKASLKEKVAKMNTELNQ